ncbi:hypothetical protein EGW08_012145 [Elysia chlorotica]|uniref:G-patch domain-containing protein n=1 Tax=Elysia chlorotica TaxID=188477 RepID=A0A433TEY7_ELYCH|nr:hypothetical protein EGW08_012145 [Elysia chlorotica]
MASDGSDDDDFVALGTAVPVFFEDQPKKLITPQDLTAKDKQGRRRFHGAFTGGFSAGFFNTVGTKEGFVPSTFVSSKSRKSRNDVERPNRSSQPEDFMDDEDLEEHGIAPRKFATAEGFTSEERKRKQISDANQVTSSSALTFGAYLDDLVVPEQLTVGVKLLKKMGWREGQGLGPRVEQKKKKKKKNSQPKPGVKVYGCAPPPSDESGSDGEFVPEDLSSVTFAPKDIAPISVRPKDNVHGLGYRGLDPSLALPRSHINLFAAPPVRSTGSRKGISGQAFGVGAFEDEDEDIYAVDNLLNYDITMQPDNEGDDKFGWTAPRNHGKQTVPVTYVGKLLEGFCLSKTQLKPKKKFPAPTLPKGFKPHHWFRKHREMSHIPEHLRQGMGYNSVKLNAVDRGILLGEQPVMSSVFDLIPKADQQRIDATKEAISMTKSLNEGKASKEPLENESQNKKDAEPSSARNFLSRFQPALDAEAQDNAEKKTSNPNTPLFQSSMTFQPFRKDPAKQTRYEKYLTLVKQGGHEPYNAVASSNMTEWEKARERDEFSKAAKMFRPMSAMMSSRFVSGAMIDDDMDEKCIESGSEKTDETKAAEMKLFGKLTREEHEWHPHQLLCKRFNVPNPFPGSDIVGVPGVKRDKYSVFNFLSMGDFQSGETQQPSSSTETPGREVSHTENTMLSAKPKKTTMASVFKVLDDPNFHKPGGGHEMVTSSAVSKSLTAKEGASVEDHQEGEEKDENDQEESTADMDLFRAIFKNSDSDDSEREDDEGKNDVEIMSEDGQSSPDKHTEERDIDAAMIQEADPVVKTELRSADEAIQDSFRPLFTRRKKVNVDQEANDQLQQRLQEAPPEILSKSNEMQAPDKLPHWRSLSGSKSVFSVLEDMERNGGFKERVVASEQPLVDKEALNEEDSADSETFGPSLPPVTAEKNPDNNDGEEDGANCSTAYGPSLPVLSTSLSSTDLQERGRPVEKLENKNNRKESRSSHRKDKRKKSKRKKQKKLRKHKKSSKSRSKSRKSRHSSSGSEADSESDSDDSVSDSELLERLKGVSKSSKSLEKLRHL